MEEIIQYVMNTPENTNGNVLRDKIKAVIDKESTSDLILTFQNANTSLEDNGETLVF